MEKEKSSAEQSLEKCPRCGSNMRGTFCRKCFDRDIKEAELLVEKSERLRREVVPKLQKRYEDNVRKIYIIMAIIFVSGVVLGWLSAWNVFLQ